MSGRGSATFESVAEMRPMAILCGSKLASRDNAIINVAVGMAMVKRGEAGTRM